MSAGRGRGAALLLRALPLLLVLASPAAARAQAACQPQAAEPASATAWPAPLDRRVSLHARDVSLREALDRLSAAAGLRFSYSPEFLPLDRRVCVSQRSIAVGALLERLLAGTRVRPVVASTGHVVLAPEPASAPVSGLLADQPIALERVVVTGTATGAAERSLPIALTVIRGSALLQGGVGEMSEAMRASVPGVWAWKRSPTSLLTRYGSIRGASSFGVSYPKVYIDGIEVANPLLLSRFAPEGIDRIEVIRGPQGAALYGTDAISGVVNIVTSAQGVDAGVPRVSFRSQLGLARSDFAASPALAQEHGITFRSGSTTRSANVSVAGGSLGEFVPDAFNRFVVANGSARAVGSRTIVTGTARVFAEQAGRAQSPVLAGFVTAPPGPGADPDAEPTSQSVQQYTAGISARFAQNERWTHSLIAGMDRHRLVDVADEDLPIPSLSPQMRRLSNSDAMRGTLRLSSVARLDTPDDVPTSLTLALEHGVLRVQGEADDERAPDHDPRQPPPPDTRVVDWRANTGVVAQANAALRESLYLTGGLRVERNEGLGDRSGIAALPMLGGALVTQRGAATLKLRSSYGKGIRPPQSATRETVWSRPRAHTPAPDLDPEEQSGVEAGVDVLVGSALTLQVTRFDQLASGLIQRVVLAPEPSAGNDLRSRRVRSELQNVGEITNRGWEVQGVVRRGGLSATAALSLVDSRVRRVAAGYTGDLRPGDRMLDVPARTASLSLGWTGSRVSTSLSAARAEDWVGYDRLALAEDFARVGRLPRGASGAQLRPYWRTYDGATDLQAVAELRVGPGLSLMLQGENLLDRQQGEPDNVTVLPGRTLGFGLRASF